MYVCVWGGGGGACVGVGVGKSTELSLHMVWE